MQTYNTKRPKISTFYIKRLFKSLQHSKQISNVLYEYLTNTTLKFCILNQILNIILKLRRIILIICSIKEVTHDIHFKGNIYKLLVRCFVHI